MFILIHLIPLVESGNKATTETKMQKMVNLLEFDVHNALSIQMLLVVLACYQL